MIDRLLIKEIISDFHSRPLPDFTPRSFDLTCPESKIRTLIGARRTGKTFCFYQLINALLNQEIVKEQILFINFEDERLLPLELSDVSLILNTFYELFPPFKDKKVYLFFDEIQNIPQWELFIRRVHDNENVQINLTGSSSRLMSKEISTSLRGRTLTYEIFPFSFFEYLRFHNIDRDIQSSKDRSHIINAFDSYLFKGGFPEVLNCSETFRLKILQDYFNMILYKDLIERYDIRNHGLIKYLLKFLLSNNANPFSVNKFYRDAKSQGYKCSKDTLHNYVSYLEDAFCFSLVSIFSDSVRKQQVNYRKVYAIDHGLVTGLVSSLSYSTGRLLETMVYNQLRRRFTQGDIYYYRTTNNQEIDFLILKQGAVHSLIQVSETIAAAPTRERETNALRRAMQELHITEATIITGNERDTLEQNGLTINIIPFWHWSLVSI